MSNEKIFIGPKLRELRNARNLTQSQMANELGVSTSFVNLVEHNQRSASLKFLLSLSDRFDIDWRSLTNQDMGMILSDLRRITKDPAFCDTPPAIEELRSAIESAPNLVSGLINVFSAYRSYQEHLSEHSEYMKANGGFVLNAEQAVHDFLRNHNNYFPTLEDAATDTGLTDVKDRRDLYGLLKDRLFETHKVQVAHVEYNVLGASVSTYDAEKKIIMLSDILDHPNAVRELAKYLALLEYRTLLDDLIPKSLAGNEKTAMWCRDELANYFGAALVMPYDKFYGWAQESRFDIDQLSARFTVSYEQACHRLTTLQKPGRRGISFFFLRIDRGGNVSKRYNVTPIHFAKFGGACPKLDLHYCFRVPGRILTQIVEMPDNSKYLTINRTVDRPAIKYSREDKRLAVSLGCSIAHLPHVVYGKGLDIDSADLVTKVGTNCRQCPRSNCDQRAHDPVFADVDLSVGPQALKLTNNSQEAS